MYIDYTPEQNALRTEIRAYMAELMTEELEAELAQTEGGGPLYMEAIRTMGRDGWLGIGWPKEHGGQGRGPIEQFIFFDEVQGAGLPVPILTLNTVGPTLLRFGTEAQKAIYPPQILKGECHFSIGYSEPSAGTDLASLKCKATRDGDTYLINGQKIWTSLADHADYIWLAARTDPDAPKHKGISILIVPADAQGVSISRIHVLGNNNVHAVYLDNVRIPAANLVGPEHGGWKLITTQLNHERVALNAVAPMANLAEDTRRWAAQTPGRRPGTTLLDEPWVQMNLARVEAKLEALKLFNWQQAWSIAKERLGPAEAGAIKVYGSEFYVEGSRLLMEVLAEAGTLQWGSPGAALQGRLERFYRTALVLTFGGGCNEIQRDLIAMAGLRMPRARR
ncbi:MAG: acyl-CoA dehydrogenase family protein [Myxococcota bacterium]